MGKFDVSLATLSILKFYKYSLNCIAVQFSHNSFSIKVQCIRDLLALSKICQSLEDFY